jgi:hypothetical protein
MLAPVLKAALILCVLLEGGWMAFDGGRALVVGDHVTPKAGQYAGQLGPWAKVVRALEIRPRGALMKGIFLVYGVLWLLVAAAFLFGVSWSWWGMLCSTDTGRDHMMGQQRGAETRGTTPEVPA